MPSSARVGVLRRSVIRVAAAPASWAAHIEPISTSMPYGTRRAISEVARTSAAVTSPWLTSHAPPPRLTRRISGTASNEEPSELTVMSGRTQS